MWNPIWNRTRDHPLVATQPTALACSSLFGTLCVCVFYTITFYRIWAVFLPLSTSVDRCSFNGLIWYHIPAGLYCVIILEGWGCVPAFYQLFNQFLSVATDSGPTTFPWNHRGSFLLRECLWSIGKAQSITGTMRRNGTDVWHSFPRRVVHDILFLM